MLRDPHLNRIVEAEASFRLSNLDAIWTYLLAAPNTLPLKCSNYLSKYQGRY